MIDLKGQRFGHLLVLEYDKEFSQKKNNSKRYWKCLCDCGNITFVQTQCLRAGETTSCGCNRSKNAKIIGQKNFKDITGEQYHLLTALSYDTETSKKKGSTYWFFKCECGNIKSIRASNVKFGTVKSCGCLKTSYGEYQIEKILKDNKINYRKEFVFQDLKSPRNEFLRFDFAIFKDEEIKYLIEYNGEQHYKENIFFDRKMSLQERQLYDKMKKEYCDKRKIPFIVIKYNQPILKDDIIKEEYLYG